MNEGPLAGVRVIDMTTVVVGPICTRTLADQGADVIKVEAPGGDLLRTMAKGSRNPGMSGKFINFNRNKRSICLDIKKTDAMDVLKRMISAADVFVSNIRPDALSRAGLDYPALESINPRLIYSGIVAFGGGGRYYNKPAYDPIIQSLSGVAGAFERVDGEPRFAPMVMTDHITGLIAAQNISSALYRREKTGRGESIETPMLENMVSFMCSEHLAGKTFVPPIGQAGDNRLLSPEYRPLPTDNGFITVGPNTNRQACAFFDAIGRPELKSDARFKDPAARTANATDYFEVSKSGLRKKTTEEWLDIFEKLDVPAAAYNSLDDLLTDPHLVEAEFFEEVEHPSEGRIVQTRTPNRFSEGMRTETQPAPRLGEHTVQILEEFGVRDDALELLLASGAAVQAA